MGAFVDDAGRFVEGGTVGLMMGAKVIGAELSARTIGATLTGDSLPGRLENGAYDIDPSIGGMLLGDSEKVTGLEVIGGKVTGVRLSGLEETGTFDRASLLGMSLGTKLGTSLGKKLGISESSNVEEFMGASDVTSPSATGSEVAGTIVPGVLLLIGLDTVGVTALVGVAVSVVVVDDGANVVVGTTAGESEVLDDDTGLHSH
jgi:hypothetical protein